VSVWVRGTKLICQLHPPMHRFVVGWWVVHRRPQKIELWWGQIWPCARPWNTWL